jgi:hypothetical protein
MKLKSDITKLKAVILRETGEDEKVIEKIISSGNDQGWKGRAQQIVLLKSKVKDLTKQIEHQKSKHFLKTNK